MSKYSILHFNFLLAFPIARRKAESVALPIPFLFISQTPAIPIPQVNAFFFIHLPDFSLCLDVSFFESSTFTLLSLNRFIDRSLGKTTHPATTGPEKLPLPTSSTPATRLIPFSQSFFSKKKFGIFIFL